MTDTRKLEQSCPCGRWEAAGSYCSGCSRPMTPADWYVNGDRVRRSRTAPEALVPPINRPSTLGVAPDTRKAVA